MVKFTTVHPHYDDMEVTVVADVDNEGQFAHATIETVTGPNGEDINPDITVTTALGKCRWRDLLEEQACEELDSAEEYREYCRERAMYARHRQMLGRE